VLVRLPLVTAAGLALAAGLAVRTARTLGARPAGFDRLARRSAPLLALALAATVAASYGRGLWAEVRAAARRPGMATKATATAGAGPRNVLLLVLDTVRSDRLGLGAGPRARAPHLARLAARGVRFDHALSTAPWTAPAHAGMFTGRWCHELSVGWDRPLDRTWPTLAEFLAARGYATAGFVANTTYCSYETGLDRGFAHYEDYDVTPRAVLLCSALVQRTWNFVGKRPALARLLARGGLSASGRKSAARINRDFLRWLDRAGDRPFFAFLNYYDAHHPYLTPGHPPASVADEAILRDGWGLD
jgi:arylsulfatase A-like enzyme